MTRGHVFARPDGDLTGRPRLSDTWLAFGEDKPTSKVSYWRPSCLVVQKTKQSVRSSWINIIHLEILFPAD